MLKSTPVSGTELTVGINAFEFYFYFLSWKCQKERGEKGKKKHIIMEMSTTTTKRRKKEHYHGNVSKYQHVQIISIYINSLLFVCLFD